MCEGERCLSEAGPEQHSAQGRCRGGGVGGGEGQGGSVKEETQKPDRENLGDGSS